MDAQDTENKSLATQLDIEEHDVINQIVQEQNSGDLKNLTHMFNAVQTKKNALRVSKLNTLFDKVSDSIIERFEKRPDEFSNRDLLDYMSTTQTALEKAQKGLNMVEEIPAITFNQQNNNQVNININDAEDTKLSRESRERVMDVIAAILNNNTQNEVIEITPNEEKQVSNEGEQNG